MELKDRQAVFDRTRFTYTFLGAALPGDALPADRLLAVSLVCVSFSTASPPDALLVAGRAPFFAQFSCVNADEENQFSSTARGSAAETGKDDFWISEDHRSTHRHLTHPIYRAG